MNNSITTPRRLPVGVQDFEKLREDGSVYVDKTMYIERLLQSPAPYFLGRPRRFGKSLFITMLEAYFLGKKHLFDGLYISKVEKEWKEYPVFHIEFVGEKYTDHKSFMSSLDANLCALEEKYGKNELDDTPSRRLKGLIKRASEQTKQKVVFLADEYDKPLLDTIDNPELNERIRETLKGFYGVLKEMDAYLKFIFITGVTKFSKVSVFSDLNQLVDISLDEKFSSICGISKAELHSGFKPEIEALSIARGLSYDETLLKLKYLYDGYHFAKVSEDIYNPFSVLNTFFKNDFGMYWFKTGTPTFLVKMLRDMEFDLPALEDDVWATQNNIDDYRYDNSDPVPVLYQTGYLTVKHYDVKKDVYVLGYPDEEVKYGFLNELLPIYFSQTPTVSTTSVIKISDDLDNGDVESMLTRLKAFFASIPYDLQDKKHKNEKYFQSLFYVIFAMLGQYVQAEVKSAKGRADAVVKTPTHIFVFEFKMERNATAEDAIKQINEKEYLIPYAADNRQMVKVGVEFSIDEGSIKRWLVE